MAHTVLPLLVAALFTGVLAGFEPAITPILVGEAVALGQNRIEAVHTRFHRPYRLQVSKPPIDYIDVVTPFRRVVLLTEERISTTGRGLTQLEAREALGDRAGVVELRVELTFHPFNVFVGVPAYEVELVPPGTGARRVSPVSTTPIPRFGPRLESGPARLPAGVTDPQIGQPLTGGTIVADYPVDRLDADGVYDVIVSEQSREIGRARVSFASLR